jgi:hypothetical protein
VESDTATVGDEDDTGLRAVLCCGRERHRRRTTDHEAGKSRYGRGE